MTTNKSLTEKPMIKNKILTIALILAFLTSNFLTGPVSAANPDIWEPITPIGADGTFTAIASMGSHVFLGTSQGIYKNSNYGEAGSWVQMNSGLTNLNITSFAIGWTIDGGTGDFVADDNTTIYASTGGGVFKSTLGGNSWTPVNNGLAELDITDVEIDQYRALFVDGPSTIYAAASSTGGVYRSDDAGANWVLIDTGISGMKTKKIITDFGSGSIYAISSNNEVYASTLYSIDFATNEAWSPIYASSTPLNNISILNASGAKEFLATDAGILKSNDAATSWELKNQGLSDLGINSVQAGYPNSIDISSGVIVYAASRQGVYKSNDEGETWLEANLGLGNVDVKDISTNPATSTLAYAITNTEIYRLSLSNSTVTPTANDVTPPASIYTLTGTDIATSSLTLHWTATGDDNLIGTATSYDIRYATSSIDVTNWTTSTPVVNEPLPLESGNDQSMIVSGLQPGTRYYFTMKALDEVPNASGLSVTYSVQTLPIDNTAPIITAFDISDAAASTTVSVTSFSATDTIGVTKYLITESSSTPSLADPSWSVLVPATFTFPASGNQTAYAWTRDAAGNISTAASSSVMIDLAVPSTPASLLATTVSSVQINLAWATSTDNVAVTGYNIYRNNALVASVTTSTYGDTGLSASTVYAYEVAAYDAAGNESVRSASSSATTQAAPVTQSSSSGSSSGGGGGGGGLDVTAPQKPAYASIERINNTIRLTWNNPADADLGEMVVVKRETAATSTSYSLVSSGARTTVVGTSTSYSETDNDASKNFYYYIFAKDKAGNISDSLIMVVLSQTGATASASASQNNQSTATPASYEDGVRSEAAIIFSQSAAIKLSDAEIAIYQRITRNETLSGNTKYSVAYFIRQGTASTLKLGAGERAGSISSYRKAFGHLPKTTEDWMDVVKIGNGRWTKATSAKAETDSTLVFKKIYGRSPSLQNARDDAAVKVMAYGLRPSIRNQNSEKAAIRSFKAIFKKAPTLAADWDIVRAIAYSGAKR